METYAKTGVIPVLKFNSFTINLSLLSSLPLFLSHSFVFFFFTQLKNLYLKRLRVSVKGTGP